LEAWIYGQKEKIEEDDEDSAAVQVGVTDLTDIQRQLDWGLQLGDFC
jgi:hypothetical protein